MEKQLTEQQGEQQSLRQRVLDALDNPSTVLPAEWRQQKPAMYRAVKVFLSAWIAPAVREWLHGRSDAEVQAWAVGVLQQLADIAGLKVVPKG